MKTLKSIDYAQIETKIVLLNLSYIISNIHKIQFCNVKQFT